MRPTGWTLNQCDWCLSKKRLGYRNTEGGQCKETQQEDGYLPARDNDLRKSHPCPQADLVLWPPELWVNKCVLCKPPKPSLYFLMAAQAHQYSVCVCVCVCVCIVLCVGTGSSRVTTLPWLPWLKAPQQPHLVTSFLHCLDQASPAESIWVAAVTDARPGSPSGRIWEGGQSWNSRKALSLQLRAGGARLLKTRLKGNKRCLMHLHSKKKKQNLGIFLITKSCDKVHQPI